MRKELLLALAGSLSLFIAQCTDLPTTGRMAKEKGKSVRIAITTPAHFDTIAASARIRISASDMQTIEQPLSIQDSMISGVIHHIPAGYTRKFEVFVNGYDSTLRYYGSAYADVFSNDTIYVSIVLRKPGGTAIISGYIEEFNSGDSLTQPSKPYLYDYIVLDTNPTRSIVSFATNPADTGIYPKLGYQWVVSGVINGDTLYYKRQATNRFIDTIYADGFYQIKVQSYYVERPNVVSPFSNILYYEIRNGIPLIDTFPTWDTTPPVITLLGPDSIIIMRGDSSYDPGATAFDNVDGDLTNRIVRSGYINPYVTGVYYLTYSVSDNAGNSSQRVRMVVVRKLVFDMTPPVITLYGNKILYLGINEAFIEPGYSAFDNVDGNITSKVIVQYSQPKFLPDSGRIPESQVIYSVSDAAGNKTMVQRTIIRSTIPQLSRPWIIHNWVVDTFPSSLNVRFGTDTVFAYSDSVYYDWTIMSPLRIGDTVRTNTSYLDYNFKKDGLYAVAVRAYSKFPRTVVSQRSLPFWFEIENYTIVAPDTLL